MTDAISHRGPDGEGFFLQPGLALGHRRLAIIDPAGGQQPMFNEDRSIAIVFNGEIFNFETLRQELSDLGHVFENRCDTEAIVHAWESWGADCVTRLSGQFAFALWDSNAQTLFCARDRMGEKPFYYAHVDGAFVFGSEIAALAAYPGMPRELRPEAVDDFFAYGYVPEPGTIFDGVMKLPPAHTLLLDRSGRKPRIERYWSPPDRTQPIAEAEAAPLLREQLTRAVGACLVSDVPLGAFLSGGVDSSAVVAAASLQRTTKLDTFTVGFDGAEDETPFARQVAERYATTQHNDRAAATDMIAAARIQARAFGEPFGDSSAVPTMTVCRLARQHATVALSGDGGDEVFGGYRRYRWHSLVSGVRRHLPAGVRRHAIGTLAALYPKLDRAPRFLRAKHTLTELSLDSALGYARTITRTQQSERHALFSPALRTRDCRPRSGGSHTRGDGRGPRGGPAAAGTADGSGHLAARRHPDQGGPRQHGRLAGGPRAVPGPRIPELGHGAARRAEDRRRRRQAHPEKGAGTAAAARYPISAETGLHQRPRAVVPQPDGARACPGARAGHAG